MAEYHLAQVNIARALYPLDDPRIAEFMENLARINALAEQSAGFVWRLQDEAGNATGIHAFDDPTLLVNLTVWESVEALHQYVYYSEHTAYFRRRPEWFEKLDRPIVVMWWIPAGHIPTTEEAKERLTMLETHGATPLAFTFKQRITVEEMLRASVVD